MPSAFGEGETVRPATRPSRTRTMVSGAPSKLPLLLRSMYTIQPWPQEPPLQAVWSWLAQMPTRCERAIAVARAKVMSDIRSPAAVEMRLFITIEVSAGAAMPSRTAISATTNISSMTVKPDALGIQPPFSGVKCWAPPGGGAKACDRRLESRRGRCRAAEQVHATPRCSNVRRYNRALVPLAGVAQVVEQLIRNQ